MTPTPAGLRSRPLHLRIALLVALVTSLLAGGPIPSVFGQATESVVIGGSLEPSRLEIAAGTTVTWRNEDAERHRVRSQAGPVAFDSGNLEPGASFDFTFDVAGTYAYLDERDDENAAWFGTIVVVPATQGSPTAGATPLLLPQSGEISIVDRAFSPVALQVASGATVTWTNADTEGHTVTAVDGAFDSGIMAEGATFSATLDTPGAYDYFCAIHPEMRGSLTVAEPTGASAGGG